MRMEEWKEKYGNQRPLKKVLEKIMKEIGAEMIERKPAFKDCVVSGTCLTDGCENKYKLITHSLVEVGPFCSFCKRFRKPLRENRQLLKDHRPDVYQSIIHCEIDKDLLTMGMNVVATYQCKEACSRCETHHVWSSTINKRNLPSKFGNCPFCSGNQLCPCMKEGEFRCYMCKKIKKDEERSPGNTRCRICTRMMNDGDKKKMIHYLWQRTSSIMKRCENKCGDLTEQHLMEKYENQGGLCFISGIPLALGTFHDWQISVERVVEKGGRYSNDNTVLICREFQSGSRQFTQEIWDDMCALILGAEEEQEDKEMLEELIQKEINTPTPKRRIERRTKKEMVPNEDGKRMCKDCKEWKAEEEMGHRRSVICKACRIVVRNKIKATFHGRLHYMYKTAEHGHVKRKLEFTITEHDLESVYLKQRGRCLYSKIPLEFSGQYQMSLERVDPKKGYLPDNIGLIVLGLNSSDWTRMQHEKDTRDGSSGWNREKLLSAVKQNPRTITPSPSSVLAVLQKLEEERNKFLQT